VVAAVVDARFYKMQKGQNGMIVTLSAERTSERGRRFAKGQVEDTLGMPRHYNERIRICDLGYLQQAYVDEKERL